MNSPWLIQQTVPASGSARSPGNIRLVKARTLSITASVKFNASGDTDTTVYLYYSPDGQNWDTVAYTSFALTVSAGNTVQRTVPINVPEHGYIRCAVTNGDSSYTITNVKLWYTIQSYENPLIMEHGNILGDPGEEGKLTDQSYSSLADKY